MSFTFYVKMLIIITLYYSLYGAIYYAVEDYLYKSLGFVLIFFFFILFEIYPYYFWQTKYYVAVDYFPIAITYAFYVLTFLVLLFLLPKYFSIKYSYKDKYTIKEKSTLMQYSEDNINSCYLRKYVVYNYLEIIINWITGIISSFFLLFFSNLKILQYILDFFIINIFYRFRPTYYASIKDGPDLLSLFTNFIPIFTIIKAVAFDLLYWQPLFYFTSLRFFVFLFLPITILIIFRFLLDYCSFKLYYLKKEISLGNTVQKNQQLLSLFLVCFDYSIYFYAVYKMFFEEALIFFIFTLFILVSCVEFFSISPFCFIESFYHVWKDLITKFI